MFPLLIFEKISGGSIHHVKKNPFYIPKSDAWDFMYYHLVIGTLIVSFIGGGGGGHDFSAKFPLGLHVIL